MDYRPAVLLYTALSLGGLVWRVHAAVQAAASMLGKGPMSLEPGDGADVLSALLQSRLTIALIVNLVANGFLLISLFTKVIFFGHLTPQESHKLAERLVQYVLFKLLFLSLVELNDADGALWLVCFTLLGYLKMFTGLARDRFERLNASPAASVFAHTRTFSLLFFVLFSDVGWIYFCISTFKDRGWNTLLLLLTEAMTIALETAQTLVHYSVHLGEAWHQLQGGRDSDSDENQTGSGPSAWEWRGSFLYHTNLVLEVSNLLLKLCHFLHIWYLHGINPQLLDALLFLNIRTLLMKLKRRLQGYLHYRAATRSLHRTFPDATPEQLLEFDDCCAICKDPMSAAKKLPCSHLFHLSCLRSWLDQGVQDNYSCPTCRSPFVCSGPRSRQPRAAANFQPLDTTRLFGDGMEDAGEIQGGVAGFVQQDEGGAAGGQGGVYLGVETENREGSDANGNGSASTVLQGGAVLPGRSDSRLVRRHVQPAEREETGSLAETHGRYTEGWRIPADETPGATITQSLRLRNGGWFPGAGAAGGVLATLMGGRRVVEQQELGGGEEEGGSHASGGPSSWWWLGRGGPSEPSTLLNQHLRDGSAVARLGNVGSMELLAGSDDSLLRMVETVRDVLPHVPTAAIIQDLRRTRSASVTLNHLLETNL